MGLTSIIHMAAELFPTVPRSRKKSGTPKSAPTLKHTSCLFVRLNAIFVLTFVKSFGTDTYAILFNSFALNVH